MASPDRHIQQWKHNRAFLATVASPYHDWMVTVAFYVALHAVDALLAHDRVSGIVNHDSRNRVLRETNRYTQIQRHYQPLYSLSQTIRYFAQPTMWIPADQIESQVLKRYLYPIEQSVQKLIGRDIGAAAITLHTGKAGG